jgi:urate oxidase
MIELGPNRYGKSAIRVVRVDRTARPNRVWDLTVDVALEGDFDAAHVDGDNALVIPTDTMKNTVYGLAPDHLTGSIEAFGLALARHFRAFPQVSAARIAIRQHAWAPIELGAGPAVDALQRVGPADRAALVTARQTGESVEAGVIDLRVMKTTRSTFVGFPRDRYTTLPEATDRMMATAVEAAWRYEPAALEGLDFDAAHAAVLATLLEVFAEHDSPSVQASIWEMARAMLERHRDLDEVRMRLPNLHHWLVDLERMGEPATTDVYVATTEPHGLIEATVRRSAG